MSSESGQNSEALADIAHSITDAISGIHGVPLPPAVKRSFWKALGTLITGVVDIPAAWLESKSQLIRDETAARSLISSEAARAATKKFSSDERLIERAVDHFGARILKEQQNRESIVKAALEELNSDPPSEDSNQEIDEDWLDMFSRIAEKRSNQDMQLYLAKLLAGEIKKPGSFAPSTVEVLSRLTPSLAQTFQNFCNISMTLKLPAQLVGSLDDFCFVVVEPYGNPGQNALSELGFSYQIITKLQDAGLVQNDFTAWRDLSAAIFSLPVEIGGVELGGSIVSFTIPEEFSQEAILKTVKAKVLNFTTAGTQLRQIIHATPNKQYVEKFKSWVISTYGLQA